MITDRDRLLYFSIKIEVPQEIYIRPDAREIKNRLKEEGYYLYIYPPSEYPSGGDKWRVRQNREEVYNMPVFVTSSPKKPIKLPLEPIYTTPGNIPSEIEGTIPDEIEAYERDLGALCVLDEIEERGLEGTETYLKIRIENPSNNLVRLLLRVSEEDDS